MSICKLAKKIRVYRKCNSNNKGRYQKIRYFMLFLFFELIFTSITIVLLVFYGPFENLKKNVVGALITSGRHGYIAQMFLSDNQINMLTNKKNADNNMKKPTENINMDAINISKKNNSDIERYDIGGKHFKGYLLIVHNPAKVKVGVTKNIGIEGELTSQIAKDNNAVAAINAGGFSDVSSSESSLYTGTGGKPVGILIAKGMIVSNNDGKADQKVTTMGITEEGKLLVGNYSINELIANNVKEAVSFSPILVLNGKPYYIEETGGLAPRTAIGQTKNGDILMLVIDGRQLASIGATYDDLQNIMLQYGAENAINLDGGSSTAMYYNSEIINNPSDAAGERYVPSAIYVDN